MIHLDFDVSDMTFTTAARSHAHSSAGALVGSYRDKKWLFVLSGGARAIQVRLVGAGQPIPGGRPLPGWSATPSGFTWSGGLRYDLSRNAHIGLSIGQDVLTTPLSTGGANFQHYVRIDGVFNLI